MTDHDQTLRLLWLAQSAVERGEQLQALGYLGGAIALLTEERAA